MLTAMGGVALIVTANPLCVVLGASMMSGGIGGGMNSYKQAKDPN